MHFVHPLKLYLLHLLLFNGQVALFTIHQWDQSHLIGKVSKLYFFFQVTNATSILVNLSSTFWSSPPSTISSSRLLQQSEYPKFGVYRVYVNGIRVGTGEEGIVVLPGENEYEILKGLDPTVSYSIILWYTTDPVFNSWPDLDQGIGCFQTVQSF